MGLAAADAVRNRDAAPPVETATELPERELLVERLRAAGVGGELLVSVAGDCRRAIWSLPTLTRIGADRVCGPPEDPLIAERPDGNRSLADEEGIVLLLAGCEGGAECRRLLIPRAELEAPGLRHPNAPLLSPRLRILVDGVAWLGDDEAVVLLSLRRSGRPDLRANQLLAFFAGPRVRAVAPFFRGDLARPTASPDGAYVAVVPGLVLRRDGSEVTLPPPLRRSRALAWSPDSRWLALAQRGSVVLVSVESLVRYDVTGSSVRTIDLPLEAAELEWR